MCNLKAGFDASQCPLRRKIILPREGKKMSVLKFLEKNFELILLAIMLAVFTAMMFLNVVLRYTMGSAVVWGDELCRYCLVASTFLSIPIWIRRRSGIRVAAIISLLPGRVQEALDFVVHILLLVRLGYLFFVCISVYQTIEESGQVSAAMRMPTSWLYMIVAFGFFLSIIRILQVIVIMARECRQAGRSEKD